MTQVNQLFNRPARAKPGGDHFFKSVPRWESDGGHPTRSHDLDACTLGPALKHNINIANCDKPNFAFFYVLLTISEPQLNNSNMTSNSSTDPRSYTYGTTTFSTLTPSYTESSGMLLLHTTPNTTLTLHRHCIFFIQRRFLRTPNAPYNSLPLPFYATL